MYARDVSVPLVVLPLSACFVMDVLLNGGRSRAIRRNALSLCAGPSMFTRACSLKCNGWCFMMFASARGVYVWVVLRVSAQTSVS